MVVKVNGTLFDVKVRVCAGGLRNTTGESRKEVTAINTETREPSYFDTYENPVTEQELQEFLENKIY